MARPLRLPERMAFGVPAGTRKRVERAAAADGIPTPDWLRRAVRLQLEAARKREAARRQREAQ